MKKFLLSIFAMFLAFANLQAEEVTVYTLEPAEGSNNSYAGNCDIAIGDITWNLTGNSQMIPWRIGGKNITDVDRTLYSKNPMAGTVDKVVLSIGTVNSITVNSAKLLVADNADFTNAVETPFTVTANSDSEIAVTAPAGSYYKFVFNVTSGTSNKYIQISKAVFYSSTSGETTAAAAPSLPADCSFTESKTIEITNNEVGATVYYTTDGENFNEYVGEFTINETTTVKAYAQIGDDVATKSFEVTRTYTKIEAKTIAEVIEAGIGEAYTKGTVVATYAKGFLLNDETGYILVYQGNAPTVAEGDVININGKTSMYGGLLQFAAGANIEKTGTAEVTHPEAVVMDGAAFDAFLTAPEVKYVEYIGTLTINGNYYNVAVEGAETAIASIQYPNDGLVTVESGEVIKVTGYTIGYNKSYVNTMAVKVEAYVEPTPEPEEPAAGIEVGKHYRIKSTSNGEYLTIGDTNDNQYGHVHGAALDEANDNQVFTFIAVEGQENTYYVQSVAGKYFSYEGTGAGWNVNGTDDATKAHALTFEAAEGELQYLIKCYNASKSDYKYFKYEYVNASGKYHPFNDADLDKAEVWTLEEAAVEPEPEVPFEVVAVTPTEAVAELTTVTVEFSEEIEGTFDMMGMTQIYLGTRSNGCSFEVNGKVLTITPFNAINTPGEYKLVIPEGLITRKSNGEAVTMNGEYVFTVKEAVVEPEPEEPATVVITSVDQLSNDKLYTIVSKDTGRGGMFAGEGATLVDMCGVTYNNAQACHSIERDANDPRQQFAFVNYEGKFYLYSVSEKKFVAKNGDVNKLTAEAPFDYITVALEAESGGDYFSLFINDANYITASPGWCSNTSRNTCIQTTLTSKSQSDGWDDGAWFTITQVGDFDATEALALLSATPEPEAPFEVVAVTPTEAVAELTTVTVEFSEEIEGTFDMMGMTQIYLGTRSNGCSFEVNGKVLTITPFNAINTPGEYKLVIPEGLITRKSNGEAVTMNGEYVFTVKEAEAPFEVVAVTPTEAVAELTTVTVEFSEEIEGTFDMMGMTQIYLGTRSNGCSFEVNGKVLTITPFNAINTPGEYKLVIPEGLITRKSNGEAVTMNGEYVFTVKEAVVEPETFTVTAALFPTVEGDVTEIKGIRVEAGQGPALAELPTGWTLTNEAGDEFEMNIQWLYDYETILIMVNPAITEAGTYTLTIPAGSLKTDDGKECEAAEFSWTIKDPYMPYNNGTRTNTGRVIRGITLTGASGENSYALTADEQTQDYTDATAVVFKVEAGEELTITFDKAGEWIHQFVFIDFDGDGFTASIAEGSEWAPAGDLVAYSFYNNDNSSDEYGWNSVGTSITGNDRSTPAVPAFKAPDAAGTYRMRVKQDWCNIDPAGDADGKFGDFKANGGQIIDLTLEVIYPIGIESVESENVNVKGIYDITGRKIEKITEGGIYIVNGKKVLVK